MNERKKEPEPEGWTENYEKCKWCLVKSKKKTSTGEQTKRLKQTRRDLEQTKLHGWKQKMWRPVSFLLTERKQRRKNTGGGAAMAKGEKKSLLEPGESHVCAYMHFVSCFFFTILLVILF